MSLPSLLSLSPHRLHRVLEIGSRACDLMKALAACLVQGDPPEPTARQIKSLLQQILDATTPSPDQ